MYWSITYNNVVHYHEFFKSKLNVSSSLNIILGRNKTTSFCLIVKSFQQSTWLFVKEFSIFRIINYYCCAKERNGVITLDGKSNITRTRFFLIYSAIISIFTVYQKCLFTITRKFLIHSKYLVLYFLTTGKKSVK